MASDSDMLVGQKTKVVGFYIHLLSVSHETHQKAMNKAYEQSVKLAASLNDEIESATATISSRSPLQ